MSVTETLELLALSDKFLLQVISLSPICHEKNRKDYPFEGDFMKKYVKTLNDHVKTARISF